MVAAIHIEIDILCLLILGTIVLQSLFNVNQQMKRILFRYTAYGIILALVLDVIWMLIDGKIFFGAFVLNQVVNAAFLSLGVVIGGIWYLYVLQTLGYSLTRRLNFIVMLPGTIATALNFLSIKTGWIFRITSDNIYERGPLFIVQTVGAIGMLLVSLIHILLAIAFHRTTASRPVLLKLLGFYIIPVIGTLLALPFVGMPGTWTCAAISIVLIYIDEQDREILRDSLTGLNNRKTLDSVFSDYARMAEEGQALFLLMLDLDHFKKINDTYGHPAGDQALVLAASVLTQSVTGRKAMVARYGGDEFLLMGFWRDEEQVLEFKKELLHGFERCMLEHSLPYILTASIGIGRYEEGQSFAQLMTAADLALYEEKRRRGGRGQNGNSAVC